MAENLPDLPTKIEWQIDRRARVQLTMLRLQEFLENYSEFPNKESGKYWMKMCWMVDIAFSLWRSAFLTDTPRDRRVIYDHMREFLKKVIEHNSITFADDHRMRSLVIGYYNANAKYRLERLYKANPDLLEIETVQAVDKLRERGDLAKEDQCELWDIYYRALVDCFNWFQRNWNLHMRPAAAHSASQEAPSGK